MTKGLLDDFWAELDLEIQRVKTTSGNKTVTAEKFCEVLPEIALPEVEEPPALKREIEEQVQVEANVSVTPVGNPDLKLDDFYNLIFDEEDYTCFGNKIQDTAVKHHKFPYGRTAQWFCLNALHPTEDKEPTESYHAKNKPRRAKCNVIKFRTLMVEMDTCSIPEQEAFVKQIGLPYSTCVYSGGKSLHFLVALETPLETEEEYRCWWKAIDKIFSSVGAAIDQSTKNPACFTRCPNSFRENKGTTQHLLEINARIKNEDMFGWFASHGILPSDFKRQVFQEDIANNPPYVGSDATDAERFEVAKKFMKDERYEPGNKNNFQFKIACLCKAVGLSQSVATEFIRQTYGPIDKRRPISSAYKKQVSTIQVKTTREWLAEKREEDNRTKNQIKADLAKKLEAVFDFFKQENENEIKK